MHGPWRSAPISALPPHMENLLAGACALPELTGVAPRKRLLWWPTSPFIPLNSGALLLWQAQASSVYTPVCGCVTLQTLQAVFRQPTTVLSSTQSSETQVLASSPCMYQQACFLGWELQRGSTDPLCQSLSVLPAANLPLSSPSSL